VIKHDWFIQEQPPGVNEELGPRAAAWGLPAAFILALGFWSAVVAVWRSVEF
jgi:hypothetical protein